MLAVFGRSILESVHIPEHTLDPSDNFMTGRVGGLVQVDDTGADVGLEVTLERCAAGGNGCEVTGANEHYDFTKTC